MIELARRTAAIHPFHVMEIIKRADALARAGRSVIHLSIGEPDFPAPEPVQRAAHAAISANETGYTSALGLDTLRSAVAAHYRRSFDVDLVPDRVVITAGASAALLLAVAALVERDAQVLVPDPSYPCNRHFVSAFDGRPVAVACGAANRFQPTAAALEAQRTVGTRGVILATPANPTGTSIAPDALGRLLGWARDHGLFAIVDEIYQGLSYEGRPHTALSWWDEAIVINSFSKSFAMTGWRLGWMVVPPAIVPAVERLAQNLYICPSTIAQRAALACFGDEATAIVEQRRREFQLRRDMIVPALQRLGFEVPAVPDGAFYVWCDVSRFTDDSEAFAGELLDATGVCVVPGKDFGSYGVDRWIRVSYATSTDRIVSALERIAAWLARR